MTNYDITTSTPTFLRNLTWGQDLGGAPSLQGAGGVGGLLMVEEITGTTTTAYHFHYDGNGNVTEVTDLNGNPAATYRYDAFGNTLISTGSYANDNRYRFSTKPLDAEVTNAPLYYYAYRYYDPATGRWLSRDPIEERGGINLYRFVGNDGVGRWDYCGCFASVLFVMNFDGNPADAGSLDSAKINMEKAIGYAMELRRELEAMTDDDFERKTANGVFALWWLDHTGNAQQEEAAKTEVNVSRSELIQWMHHEESSSVAELQTGSLTPDSVFDAMRGLPSGKEEYLFDSVQLVMHGMKERGSRYGGFNDRIPFADLREVLSELHYFESRALTSCGANDGLFADNRLIYARRSWGEDDCTLTFTPIQAGHELLENPE